MSNINFGTERGCTILKKIIEDYWKKRGCVPFVRVVQISDSDKGAFGLRSDIGMYLPRGVRE